MEPVDFSITMLAEEPRLAYDRVNLTKYFAGSSVEDLTLTSREFFDKNGIELHSGDPVSWHRPCRQTRHHPQRRGIRIRQAGAGHRLEALRAAGAGPRPPGVLRLPHHRGPRGHQRGAANAEERRGHRRRPAGPRMRQGAQGHGPRDPRGGVRAAADGGAGGRGRRRRAAPRIEALGVHVHTGKNTTRSTMARRRGTACSSPTALTSKPT